MATEKRSSVSRAPVRSSELTRTRHRIQRNARKMRPRRGQSQLRSAAGRSPPTSSMKSSSSVPCPCAPGAHLLDASLRDDAAVGDDADVRRQPLDDLENVRRQEDRAAARDERVQQILDLARRDRVDPLERLVEKEQARRRQQRRRQRQLLAHPVREIRRPAWSPRPVRSISDSRSAERVLNVSAGHAMHLGDETQRFRGRQPIEQREVLGDDADAPLDLDRDRRRGSMPRMRISPPEGRSRPVRHLIVVDLPAPLGPRNP